MRRILDNNQQVAHYFANAVQSEGHGSNFYFETDRDGQCVLYSYGRHFAIARRLNINTYAFTTRRYGMATSKHLAYARSALQGRNLVYCEDPTASAATNKRAALADLNGELRAAETERRIRPATREGHKAAALRIAESFNAYLAALPESERADVEPFDVSGLEEMRAALVAEEERKRQAEEARKAAAARAEADYVRDWRNDPSMRTVGMLNHPVALRLVRKEWNEIGHAVPEGRRDVIQTSRGAEIPASDARALWPVILSVMRKERTPEEAARLVRRLGVYTLTMIHADGAITVGCHHIEFNEMARMAVTLNLAQSEEVAA